MRGGVRVSYDRAMDEGPSFPEIEAALGVVQRTLDRLTALGHDEQAFQLAKAQFSASVRSSWPGNLSTLVGSLDALARDATLRLSDDDRSDIARAIGVLAKVHHP